MNTFTPQSSYSYEEIIECGKGNLFGKGNAQLPAPPMLMFDRITNVNKDGGVPVSYTHLRAHETS